jgi:uncharacterized protein YcfJ
MESSEHGCFGSLDTHFQEYKMNSSKLTTTLTAILLLSNAGARASHEPEFLRADPNNFWVEAQVVDVEPLLRVVTVTTPQEVCRNEEVWNPAPVRRSRTPLIAGGILGGVVGNQFGGGRGQDLLTIGGALLGASIGSDVAHRNNPASGYKSVQQICAIEHVRHDEERIDGYRVTYRYAGRDFVTHTQTEPGSTIRVRVAVEPFTYNAADRLHHDRA